MQSINAQSPTKESGDELYTQQRYPEAIEAYRQFLTVQPASASALKGLGLSLVMSGNPTEGVESCSRAAALMPTDPEIRYAYGYALGALQQFEAAIPELDATLSLQTNHIAARQALVYCLIMSGRQYADSEPEKASAFLDRAHKLDKQNPDTTAALLTHYFHIDQPRKVLKVVETLTPEERSHPILRPFVERLIQDPAMLTSLRSSDSVAAPAPKPAAPSQNLTQVPCPKCALPIMSYAAICPHCGHQNRAVGSFAGRDTGPNHTWQEIAYMVMAVIYTIQGLFALLPLVALANKSAGSSFSGFTGFLVVMGVANVGIGIGLILKQEWIGFIAKVLCYLTMLSSSAGLLVFFFSAHYGQAAANLVQLCIAGFMVYLINYEMD